MKRILIILFLNLLFNSIGLSQTRIITGRVISEFLEPMAVVDIHIDTTVIGRTDLEGRFNVEIPDVTDSLILFCIGLEPALIKFTNDCDTLEVVMMTAYTYDFMTLRRVDRLRMKRFKELPNIHKRAFDLGIFKTDSPCYKHEFSSYNE